MPEPEACNFAKNEALEQVLSCEFCEISKNTFFHRTPLVAASGRCSMKKLFLKTFQYSHDERTSDKCSVKKIFLVVDRAMKVTCFYIDQNLL